LPFASKAVYELVPSLPTETTLFWFATEPEPSATESEPDVYACRPTAVDLSLCAYALEPIAIEPLPKSTRAMSDGGVEPELSIRPDTCEEYAAVRYVPRRPEVSAPEPLGVAPSIVPFSKPPLRSRPPLVAWLTMVMTCPRLAASVSWIPSATLLITVPRGRK